MQPIRRFSSSNGYSWSMSASWRFKQKKRKRSKSKESRSRDRLSKKKITKAAKIDDSIAKARPAPLTLHSVRACRLTSSVHSWVKMSRMYRLIKYWIFRPFSLIQVFQRLAQSRASRPEHKRKIWRHNWARCSPWVKITFLAWKRWLRRT